MIIAEEPAYEIYRESLGPYGTNSYIVTSTRTGESCVIDAPGEPQKVLRLLEGTNPGYLLLTHNHPDHTGALAELRNALDVRLAAHVLDTPGLEVQPDLLLEDGDVLSLGGIDIKVMHTPGHTPGGLSFLLGRYLFAGDTLFPGGPGKTWSPEGFTQIIDTITGRLYMLQEDTLVLPGHGNGITIGVSKSEYAAFAARKHGPGLFGDVLWAGP